MNLYSFVNRRAASQPTVEAIHNAEKVTTIAQFALIAKRAGEYEFTADEELTKFFRSATEIKTYSEKNENGVIFNRGLAVINGAKYDFRIFGNKGIAMPEKVWKSDEIKNATFGKCTQDGSTITEMKSANGKCYEYPVAYLKL